MTEYSINIFKLYGNSCNSCDIIENVKGKQIIITSCEKESYNGIADNVIEVSGGEYVSAYM